MKENDTISVISAFDNGERIIGKFINWEIEGQSFWLKTYHGNHLYNIWESKPEKLG